LSTVHVQAYKPTLTCETVLKKQLRTPLFDDESAAYALGHRSWAHR